MKFVQLTYNLVVDIPDEIIAEIQAIAYSYSPNEIGGILLGHYDKELKTAYITQHLTPEKSKGTPSLFERSNHNLREYLTDLYHSSDPAIHYLGDWHSHPNSVPMPSQTDFKAMQIIANHKDVQINNPLMLIIGFKKNIFDIAFYMFSDDKLFKYEQKV